VGESCGFFEDPLRPDYAGPFVECETGLKCTTNVGGGVCVVDEGFDPEMPELDYLNLYDYNYDDDDLERSIEDGDFLNSLPLEKGCENHRTTMSTLLYFYPTALGQPLWTPECQPENPKLYQSVQCRVKEDSKAHVCWCVNHESGKPTIHMHWTPTEIDDKMCDNVAVEYGYGSKRKNA